jgi:hypothetical protein
LADDRNLSFVMALALREHTFRTTLLLFGATLGVLAAWILLAELQRPRLIELPVDPQSAWMTRQEQGRAERAASFGFVRGDLWAESSFTHADLLWRNTTTDAQGAAEDVRARANLERALAYAPHRGDVWLLMALLAERFKWSGVRPDALLKMCFYTAPKEITLVPQRLALWFRLGGIDELETQDMIERDIRLLLARGANAKSDLTNAYKTMLPGNRQVVDRIIGKVDPNLATSLRLPAR